MLPTYPAVLSGDRIVWSGDSPPGLSAAGVPVHVTLLAPPSSPAERRKRMAAALEEIAARGGLPVVADPLAWEREQRADRDLPGRGE
jgi:hypothetical protein